MSKFDVVTAAPASVADTAFLTIQPGSGIEWRIENIYADYGEAIELYRCNSTTNIKIDETSEGGFGGGYKWYLTNSNYLKVKNVSGGAINMSYDGIITKE
jgi:hypothetical protein